MFGNPKDAGEVRIVNGLSRGSILYYSPPLFASYIQLGAPCANVAELACLRQLCRNTIGVCMG